MTLAGRTVVITRAEAQSAGLRDALVAAGAAVVAVPVLAVAPPVDDGGALAREAAAADTYDWVVLTSPNGVDAFAAARGATAPPLAARLAVVGTGTAARAAAHGLAVGLVPERFVAEGLVEVFPTAPADGGRVLVAQAEAARDVVVRGLRAKGWTVTTVVAYRTVAAPVDPTALAAARAADAIAFTSGSTVEHYLAAAGPTAVPPVVACIGPVTAKVARAHGLTVHVLADPHTIDGLVRALDAHFARGPGAGAP